MLLETSRAVAAFLWLVLCFGVLFRVVTLKTLWKGVAFLVVAPVILGVAVTYGQQTWVQMSGPSRLAAAIGVLLVGSLVVGHMLFPELCTAITAHFIYDLLRHLVSFLLKTAVLPFRLLAWLVRSVWRPPAE